MSTSTTTTPIEPIPYDQVTPGYYWAQFQHTGPLEIVKVVEANPYDRLGPWVYIFGGAHPRLRMEFRFWQRIEVPDVSF